MKKNNFLIVILLIFLCFSNVININAEELSAEVAKKLLSKSWENVDGNIDEPVIIYLLQFKELNSHILDMFNYQFKGKKDEEAKEKWGFIVDDKKLELIKDFPSSYTVSVESWQEKKNDENMYSSYLTTVGNNPIKISMEKHIPFAENEEVKREELLEINFKPVVIDLDNKKVLTEVKMRYKGNSGSVANLNTNSWIGQNTKKPLTVVYQNFNSGKEKSRKYFALYLTTVVINSRKFNVEDKTLKAGNIEGLNKFFGLNNKRSKKINQQIGFYIGEKVYGFDLNRKSIDNIIKFNLFTGGLLEYNFCFDKSLFQGEDLYLSGCLSNKTKNNKSALFLGISDIVKYGKNTSVKISLLPVCYDIGSNEFTSGFYSLILNYDTAKLGFKYTGEYIKEELVNNLEITYKLSSNLGFRALRKQSIDGEYKKLIGIVLYN